METMHISLIARIIFAVFTLALTVFIFENIRRGRVREKFVVLWVPLAVLLAVFGVFPTLLLWVSQLAHLHYITVVVLFILVYFTLILLYTTARLSNMREDFKRLAQEMALLKAQQSENK